MATWPPRLTLELDQLMRAGHTGSILNPKVRPAKGAVAKKGGKATGALVLGPAGFLAPFIKTGARNKHPCDIQELKNRVDSIYSQTTAADQAGK